MEPVQPTAPAHVICAPVRPISVFDLRETACTAPTTLVPRYMVAFEGMASNEQEALRQRFAAEADRRWSLTLAAELDNEDDRRRRRAAAFAAALDLPDPVHWLDNIATGIPHALAGTAA
ncbi:hypothetical protein ACFC1T_08105 [Kitasatospora sp. NPDC056076]|uniref:hypothetical protein n=1 Tax=Kitasatospora sp. NPDC056076 TaxID=3345703 RepID=UPI0035D644BC